MIQHKGFTVTAIVVDVAAIDKGAYRGFSVRETNNAAAIVVIREGGASGEILDTIGLAALESKHVVYPEAIKVEGDLHVTVTGSTVVGDLRYE